MYKKKLAFLLSLSLSMPCFVFAQDIEKFKKKWFLFEKLSINSLQKCFQLEKLVAKKITDQNQRKRFDVLMNQFFELQGSILCKEYEGVNSTLVEKEHGVITKLIKKQNEIKKELFIYNLSINPLLSQFLELAERVERLSNQIEKDCEVISPSQRAVFATKADALKFKMEDMEKKAKSDYKDKMSH